jgi:nicotinamidase-related amidase
MHFSCFGSPEFERRLKGTGADCLVIFGIEAHVCVLQTALDALKRGYSVRVAADAVSSRTAENKALAIERMRQSGILVESAEMVLFQLLQKAGTDEFRKVSALIK